MTANPARLLCELIALPSVNPALLPGDESRAGERRVAEFLTATAAKAGLDVDLQEVVPGRSNVVAVLRAVRKPARRVLLAPHMDTVGVAGEHQFTPVEKGGRIYGRGACDTKGSVAAMLSAVLQLASKPARPTATEIVFCALIDEEVGQAGSRFLTRHGFKADLAIVGEPTLCKVITAHKGDLWLKLRTHGKAAHGARPDLGRNAVHEMAKIVDLLETDYAAALKRRRHPLLGPPTINVGAIAGGRQPNIVPDECTIDIDRRTIPGEKDAAVKREILRFLHRHGLKAAMADTKGDAVAPSMQTDPRLPLVRQFLRTAGQRKPLGVDYFTDAGVLAAGGIPSVVFGPGDIAQAHTVDEWVAISQLERATRLLSEFLGSLD